MIGNLIKNSRITNIILKMTTLMAAVRSDNLKKFNELVESASSKHIDQSLNIAIINDHDSFVPILLANDKLTQKGFESAFGSAIFNRKKELIKLFLGNPRMTSDLIIDKLLL